MNERLDIAVKLSVAMFSGIPFGADDFDMTASDREEEGKTIRAMARVAFTMAEALLIEDLKRPTLMDLHRAEFEKRPQDFPVR